MSIEIMFRLVCNECRRPFAAFPEGATDQVTRRNLRELRTRAANDAWGRFCKPGAESLGDYCPQCCVEISRERTARLANAKRRANKAPASEFQRGGS